MGQRAAEFATYESGEEPEVGALIFCVRQSMKGLQEIFSSWELELDLVSEPASAHCAGPLDQGKVPAP